MELEETLSRLIFESTKIRAHMRKIYEEIYNGISGNDVFLSRFDSSVRSVRVRDITIEFGDKREDIVNLSPAGTINVEVSEVYPKDYIDNPGNYTVGEPIVQPTRII